MRSMEQLARGDDREKSLVVSTPRDMRLQIEATTLGVNEDTRVNQDCHGSRTSISAISA
jgi:hypothetical protein